MPERQETPEDRDRTQQIAWYALLLVPALVPLAVGRVPFVGTPLMVNTFVYPKLLTLSLLVTVCAVSWTVGVFSGRMQPRTVPHGWLLAAVIGLAAISTAMGLSPSMGLFGDQQNALGLLVWGLVGALYVLATQLVSTAHRLREISWSAVIGGTAVAVVSFLQSVFGVDLLGLPPEAGLLWKRGASLFGNPDYAGTYLVVPALIAVSLALGGRTRREQVTAWACFAICLGALANTLTRGAWVGLAAGLVVIVIALARCKEGRAQVRVLLIVVAVGAVAAILIDESAKFVTRFADLTNLSSIGGGRLALWREATALVAQRPLFGTGPDSYRLGWYSIRSVESVALSGARSIVDDPHNLVLALAATLGIPAALTFVTFVVLALLRSAPQAFRADYESTHRVYSGWWAALFGFAVALMFATNSAVVLATIALAAGVLSAPLAVPWEGDLGARKWLGVALSIAGGLALISSSLLVAADVRLSRSQGRADLVAAAARIAPHHLFAQHQAARSEAAAALAALRAGAPDTDERLRGAEATLRSLVDRDPYDASTHILLASFLATAGEIQGPATLQRAVEAASAGLERYPMSVELATTKAFALNGRSDYDGAVSALDPVWDADPFYPDAGVVFANALIGAGETQRAAEVVSALRAWFPENPEIAQLAKSLESSGTVQPPQ